MKKIFTLFFALVAITALWAEDFSVDGIYYNILADKTNEVEVTSGSSSYSGSITIPSTVTYNGTTYSVTSIGDDAFEYCRSLASVTIGNSVTSIGDNAFYSCWSLTSITIPNSVTSIRYRAFSGCSGLTSIVVEEGNTMYDSRENCNALIETASNTLITGCENTIIANSVTSIGYDAFYGCSGLTSITIPNSVTSIGWGAFYGCSGLTSVTIGNSVTSIGDAAFYYCSGLTSITIPNSVTSIGASAFSGCKALTSITIPNSVTSIGDKAFYYCSGLTSIVVEEGNTVYDSRENCNAIIETASNTLITGCKNTTIPNSVTSIGDAAFWGCTGLTFITIPNSVTSIGEWAFCDCSSLTSVTIPNSVTSIEERAFYGCKALTSITIPNSVTSIGNYAFDDCRSLTSITIPNSVTSIGEWAFSRCSGLEKVSFKGKTPPAMGEYIFYNSNPTWVVPCGAYDVYASTEIAQQYGYAIEEYCIGGECGDYLTWTYDEDTHELAISGMHEMYDYVGSGPWGAYVNEITSITMEEGITYIGTDAFANCKYVQTLTIPEGVTQLGDAAFFNCTYLKELTLPSTLMAVADNGFALCEKLAKMNVNAVVPPVVEARTFENVDRMIPVVVPTESVSAYKAAPVWQEFNIQGKDNVESDLENISSDNGYGVMGNGKILRNGQLIIIRDGVEYNTLGQAL